jgi:hypothetical protein
MEVHHEKVRSSIMYVSDFRREGILQRRMPQRIAGRQVPLPSLGLQRPLKPMGQFPAGVVWTVISREVRPMAWPILLCSIAAMTVEPLDPSKSGQPGTSRKHFRQACM